MAFRPTSAGWEHGGHVAGASTVGMPGSLVRWSKEVLGSSGWWGHYLEVSSVDSLTPLGVELGLQPGQVMVLIHMGARFLWPPLRQQLLPSLIEAVLGEGLHSPAEVARGLFAVRGDSRAGVAFLGRFQAAANFAYANRVTMHELVQEALSRALKHAVHCDVAVDNSHDGLESDEVHGQRVWVHRHGQHRIYPAGHRSAGTVLGQTGSLAVILGAPDVPSLLVTASKGADRTSFLCSHGIATNDVLAPAAGIPPSLTNPPGDEVVHNTSYRVDDWRTGFPDTSDGFPAGTYRHPHGREA
ncbi:MAG: RtcB family protein [Bacillota bacterium]